MRINKFVKLLLAVCLFSANVSLVNAQGVVTGVVLDANSNEPLPAATVRIEGTTIGIVTDLDGTFSLKVPEGKQTIVFSFVGYGDVTKNVNLKSDSNLGEISLEPETVGLEEIMVVSSIVRDRQTPVAVSTIKAEVIIEKLGSQEFPEILKSTPSVYATKDGGGFGDGRINLRGFDSDNIGVLINGVPVNDMENGRVYWSNWAGLSDVTQTMQVQRGLGASRLAISSVGGTINIVTQSTKSKKGGTVFHGFGHDGYQRTSLSLSTGLMDNGWSITALGGKTSGQGFVDGADFEGWSYFLNVSKKVNENHILSFTAFGAPQWHNQRYPRQLIQTYRE
ncbi:MAG: carboxypeptidase-like regulatory domain-containing protein, partial [Perlabentimonas sp.]